MEIRGKTILLTGATGGIGHAIARRLSADGATLVLTGRRTEVLEPLAAELGARSLAVDLSDLDAVARLAEDCADVDGLVANAGLSASGPLLDYTPDQIARALTVNLHAPILLARLLAERLVARGDGHLVFISSLSGKSSAPGSSLYSATKFGLRGFAQGLREDLRDTGVGVSTVFPSFISDAGMFADSGTELPRGVKTRTPEQVASAVARAITANRGEIDVAPLSLRAGAIFAGIAPEISAKASRRMGADKISRSISDAHVGNR
jgi:short-subunit dehydrogenase